MADNVMNQWKHARRGFTLVELLTVIAIIAILAAIAFPVFQNVRKGVRQSNCITQMHDLYRNLKLYYADNNRYPASLLGYVQNTDGTFHSGSGQILAIEQLTYRPLTNEQKYIKDKDVFSCPDNSVKDPNKVGKVIYPAGVPLTGDVLFTSTIANNIRKSPPPPMGQPAYFYLYDSYDIGPKLDSNGLPVAGVYELHYSLDWTGGSGQNDAKNQLKYASTAPEDLTVVTWCTHHSALAGSDRVNVLMLSGKANPVNAKQFVAQGPLNFKF